MAEKNLPENYRLHFIPPKHFENFGPLDGERFLDYSEVDFSFITFLNLRFSSVFSILRKGLFFVVIRLVYLFPPQILKGSPSSRWWAEAVFSGTFSLLIHNPVRAEGVDGDGDCDPWSLLARYPNLQIVAFTIDCVGKWTWVFVC